MHERGDAKFGQPQAATPRRNSRARPTLRRPLALKAGLPERAEDILTSILSIASEGVVVLDAGLRILVFSKGAEAIFGYAPHEVLGRALEVLIPEDRREVHRRHVASFKAAGPQSRHMRGHEIWGRTKAGVTVPLEVGISRLATPDGLLFTAIIHDVSDRRRAEAELARSAAAANAANTAKSNFLAAMSHEIRTPLNGILGMAQAMARDDLPETQRERLTVVQESGEALLQILNDVLDLSKVEAGRLELEQQEFDLEELVAGAMRVYAPLAAQKGIEFTADVHRSAVGCYRGDPLRLRQILSNLLSNAVKFTAQGEVRVGVRRASGRVRLQVRDTGIGIPAERQATLFRKFEQGDASTTRRFGGTGLGLAISRELARLMGGDIGVDSAPGAGATFWAQLPLRRAPRPARRAGAPTRPGANSMAGLRILVAEDNPTNQLVVRTLLDQLGLAITMVSDGLAAVEAAAQDEFDLILMDVQMPRMDGPTATSAIRANEQASGRGRIPILALTANAMTHQVEEYRAAGMDGLVTKPIVVADLLSAIAESISPTIPGTASA